MDFYTHILEMYCPIALRAYIFPFTVSNSKKLIPRSLLCKREQHAHGNGVYVAEIAIGIYLTQYSLIIFHLSYSNETNEKCNLRQYGKISI